MTATYTAEKRRLSPTPPRPLRELPVLFHLMDVSRPKGYTAPPAFSLGGLTGLAPVDERDDAAPPAEFDLETAAKLVETKAFGSLPTEQVPAPLGPIAKEAEATSEEQPAESSVTEFATIRSEAAAHDHSDNADASATLTLDTPLETPPPTTDDAVSLRERAMERSRKRQQTRQDDWFRTQGRFIVIGFIAALGVTIYAARANRKPTAPPVAVKRQTPATDAKSGAKKAATKLPLASGPAASITGVKATNTKATAPELNTQPKAVLHPPTIPQLAQEPATTSAPTTDTLFTFSKRPEDRLASRTDDIGPVAAAPAAQAATSTTPPTSAFPNSPTLQPQYPTTSYPANYQPVAPAAVPAPGIGPPGIGPSGAPAANTAPLYPTTNSASGFRNERNGSGLY